MQCLERHQLAHPQATGVHQLEHGAVAQAELGARIRRLQQGLNLGFAERFGHAQGLAGCQQAQARVHRQALLAQRPLKIATEDRETAVGRGGFGLCVTFCKISLQMALFGLVQRQPLRGLQPLGQQSQIATVSGQGVGRQPVFKPEGIDESVDGHLAVRVHQASRFQVQSSLSFCWSTTFL